MEIDLLLIRRSVAYAMALAIIHVSTGEKGTYQVINCKILFPARHKDDI